MYRFGDQIEFRIDRRQLLLFALGGLVWTLLAFFLGMHTAAGGSSMPIHRTLQSLNWLDQRHAKHGDKEVRFLFHQPNPKEPNPEPDQSIPLKRAKAHLEDVPQHKPLARSTMHLQARTQHRTKTPPKIPTPSLPTKKNHIVRKKVAKRLTVQKNTAPNTPPNSKHTAKLQGSTKKPTPRKTQRPSHPPAKRAAHRPKANQVSRTKARYSVRFREFHDERLVLRIFKKLRKRGYRPLLSKKQDEYGAQLYQMTLGLFANRKAANRFCKEFEKLTHLEGRPMRLPRR